MTARTVPLTIAALLGFAANSVLCRCALADRTIDAVSFTAIRLAAGAAMLFLLVMTRGSRRQGSGASWPSAFALFAYAAAFSLAYVRLQTGTGALILFGLVQLTMVAWGLSQGERLRNRQWLGFALAIAGLVALTAPGLSAPDATGAALMSVAGIAWGTYSIRGKRAADAMAATAGNFARTLPFVAVLLLLPIGDHHLETRGVLLAAASGAIASGLAYSLWYAALRHLASSQAAIVQLSVPVLAAAAGIVLLGEPLRLRLLLAGSTILLGIALAVVRRPPRTR